MGSGSLQRECVECDRWGSFNTFYPSEEMHETKKGWVCDSHWKSSIEYAMILKEKVELSATGALKALTPRVEYRPASDLERRTQSLEMRFQLSEGSEEENRIFRARLAALVGR